jgi:hypothetical protein
LVERDTDSKRGVAKLSLRNMNEFMMKLTGPLSVVVDTDPFWYNRLLLELDVDYADEMSDDPKCDNFCLLCWPVVGIYQPVQSGLCMFPSGHFEVLLRGGDDDSTVLLLLLLCEQAV